MVAAVPETKGRRNTASTAPPTDLPGWRRALKPSLYAVAALLLVTSPFVAPRLLAHLDYFRLRKVEFEGVRYVRHNELRAAIPVDSTWSVWNNQDTVVRAILAHPMVLSATVERRFPGTLLVRLTERVPVAQVGTRDGLRATDALGNVLPIDPATAPLDVPIVSSADTVVLRALDELRLYAPAIYARVVSARRVAADHLLFDFHAFLVRTRDDVTVARFRDILPVEADLAQNRLRAVELDLRFQNQVIVRQP